MANPVPSTVLWTTRARRQLRRSLYSPNQCQAGTTAATTGRPDLEAAMTVEQADQSLGRLLEQCFPGCRVVVQDELFGYRQKEGQHIFLVEVCDANHDRQTGSYVIKLGPVALLRRELHGYRTCWPPALRHDLVFLPLRCFPEDQPEQPRALIYGDANQLIGVSQTCSLEEAMLDAVRFGQPTIASIRDVLVQLYERAGHLFYHIGAEDLPTRAGYTLHVPGTPAPDRDNTALERALEAWDTTDRLQQLRIEVDGLITRIDRSSADIPERRYLGANRYLRQVREALSQPLPDGPCITDFVPGMLRGPAHGDLHGRNVLVGKVRDRVLWPAVYDYEHMSDCNLVGWDFVKLETELKIRAYDQIYPRSEGRLVGLIHDFELDLARRTEGHYRLGDWPALAEEATESARLRTLILQIRHLAALHLGENRGRNHRWLEEYYFLLACYGTVTGNFDNLNHRQLLGSLLSAGVAAARLSLPYRQFRAEWLEILG